MLRREMQVLSDKIKYLLIPKPSSRLEMDFQGAGLEDQEMAAFFHGSRVSVERFPRIAHQHYATGGRELPRDAAALQSRGSALPRQRFRRFSLTERFE